MLTCEPVPLGEGPTEGTTMNVYSLPQNVAEDLARLADLIGADQ